MIYYKFQLLVFVAGLLAQVFAKYSHAEPLENFAIEDFQKKKNDNHKLDLRAFLGRN